MSTYIEYGHFPAGWTDTLTAFTDDLLHDIKVSKFTSINKDPQ